MFLFPRESANLEWFEHELAVYRALTAGKFVLAPQIRGQWRDEEVYPFPFAEVTRLTGGRPDDLVPLFGPLGAVLAQIHLVPPPDLPWPRRIARHQRPAYRWLHRALDRPPGPTPPPKRPSGWTGPTACPAGRPA